jgi:hypothetical protein
MGIFKTFINGIAYEDEQAFADLLKKEYLIRKDKQEKQGTR